MRAYQFITEYRRDKTGQALGDKLITALGNTQSFYVPDNLYSAQTVIDMAANPTKFPENNIRMSVMGQQITVSPNNARDILNQLKPRIIDAILAEIEKHDPTANKQYTQWMARVWANAGGYWKIEDLSRMDYINLYHQAKAKRLVPQEFSDINKFKSYREFENWFHNSGIVQQMEASEEESRLAAGQAEKVYEDETVTVVHPMDEAAACKYGRGTQWCTAATKGSNYFDHYNRQGPMYILLPKQPKYEGEKYQLHFPSNQYMDEGDNPINLLDLLSKRFPSLKDFFLKIEPSLADSIQFMADEKLSEFAKVIGEAVANLGYNMYTDIEQGDDGYYSWVNEQAHELGYIDQDGDIDWDKVYQDAYLKYSEWNADAGALLKTIDYIRNLSAKAVRQYIVELNHELDNGNARDLEELYPSIIREQGYSEYDDGLAKLVLNKLLVRQSNTVAKLSKATKIGEVDNYSIMILS